VARLRSLVDRIGRRGAILLVLGTMDILYGSAIVYGVTHPRNPRFTSGVWWPVSTDRVLLLPTQWWGWIWLAAGIFLLTGVAARNDSVQYSVAVFIKASWAFAAIFHVFRSDAPGLWGISSVYIAWALVTYICSGWSEDHKVDELIPAPERLRAE
jgi:hypothetical protein